MSHTPTPWKANGSIIIDSNEDVVALLHDGSTDFDNAQTNAKRIVECVNACDGMEDPHQWLEEVADMLDSITKDTLTVLAAKDNEIAQLKARVAELEIIEMKYLRFVNDPHWGKVIKGQEIIWEQIEKPQP